MDNEAAAKFAELEQRIATLEEKIKKPTLAPAAQPGQQTGQ